MSGITTHVLDTARGRPAQGIRVTLEFQVAGEWRAVGTGATDADGRCRTLVAGDVPPVAGTYRLTFDTGPYLAAEHSSTFFPHVSIVFATAEGEAHYHVPLLLSPFGYSTYRGS